MYRVVWTDKLRTIEDIPLNEPGLSLVSSGFDSGDHAKLHLQHEAHSLAKYGHRVCFDIVAI